MRMKAALLSSLAYRPKLLVLDEPFAGLDALVRDEFIQGILELAEEASGASSSRRTTSTRSSGWPTGSA